MRMLAPSIKFRTPSSSVSSSSSSPGYSCRHNGWALVAAARRRIAGATAAASSAGPPTAPAAAAAAGSRVGRKKKRPVPQLAATVTTSCAQPSQHQRDALLLLLHRRPPAVLLTNDRGGRCRRFSSSGAPSFLQGATAEAEETSSVLGGGGSDEGRIHEEGAAAGSPACPPRGGGNRDGARTAAADPFSAEEFLAEMKWAAAWNHGKSGDVYDESLWEPDSCRRVADRYDAYLQRRLVSLDSDAGNGTPASAGDDSSSPRERGDAEGPDILLSAEAVTLAFKVLLKSQLEPDELSTRVREWERALGKIRCTPLTDHLSLRLVTANGKAGNVGRVLSLLDLRMKRKYEPREREFVAAITALNAAQAPRQRSVFTSEQEQPPVDNPTRWLDAILLNMNRRGVPLTVPLANRMLLCYAAGYTGKATHHFYRVTRKPLIPPRGDEEQDSNAFENSMPHDWFYLPDDGSYRWLPVKVQLDYNRASPPFYKKPSEVRGKVLFYGNSAGDVSNGDSVGEQRAGATKIEFECDPDYSPSLAAAFAFAESLQHGACGHDGIRLDTGSYTALIKACVQRGALWRAMHVLDHVMPKEECTAPYYHLISYNLLLDGLARVGDVVTSQEYYHKMLNHGLKPDAFTVRAIVDGLLNLSDAPAAITVVQDFFNQHSILPLYTTHLKIIEVCLARGMVHEAKRHVYFLQQLWHWEPNEYHSKSFVKLMRATQRNTQLQKPALQQLFAYFGEALVDEDFM